MTAFASTAANGAIVAPNPAKKRSFIPWIFVIGMLVVVAVNAVMITFAITTFRGLAVEKPYEKGVEFNRALARAEARDRLGWQPNITLKVNRVEIEMRDAAGQPLNGAAVEVSMARPVEALKAGPYTLQAEGSGRYGSAIELPGLGQWDLALKVTRGEERFETTVRAFAK